MTVAELIEMLKELPQDRLVVVPMPEYWEGGTDYRSIQVVTAKGVFIAYTCECNHASDRHDKPNPDTGAPSHRCRDCDCLAYQSRGVEAQAVVLEVEE